MIKKNTESIYIDGVWQEFNAERSYTVHNPATLEPLTEVSKGGSEEAEKAIAAASNSLDSWSQLTGRERGRILYKAYNFMVEDINRLAKILTYEQGKPLNEARDEIKGAASYFLWYAEEASRNYGEWLPSSVSSKRLLVIPQPVGVVGAITPWNFPSSMITRKLAPALAAGCTVVLKPASVTPLSAIEIVKILERAGVPKGVVNLVTGDSRAIGEAMLSNKNVRMITFTGSTEVGKKLMSDSANHVKKIALELGGHAPILVFEDANIDKAVEMTVSSKFRNNGQTCICANRLYIHESIAETFNEKLVEKVKKMKIGTGLDKETVIGPLISADALEKVELQLADAVGNGAQIECGGNKWSGPLAGYFFEPTVLSNVEDSMVIMSEETFGPVIPIQTFNDERVAIKKANNSDYGLAAYIFTNDISRATRIAENLDYGIVGINDVFPTLAEAPFGGIKQSGNSKEGGHHGMDEFLEKKYISIGIDESV